MLESYTYKLRLVNINKTLKLRDLHDISWVPENVVGVEVFCRVEPEMELLPFVALPVYKLIMKPNCNLFNCGRIHTQVPEKLEIDLILALDVNCIMKPNCNLFNSNCCKFSI